MTGFTFDDLPLPVATAALDAFAKAMEQSGEAGVTAERFAGPVLKAAEAVLKSARLKSRSAWYMEGVKAERERCAGLAEERQATYPDDPDAAFTVLRSFADLDLSLTSTGVALVANGGARLHRIQPGKLGGHERMQSILSDVRIWTDGCELVVVEGASFGSPGRQHEMGGLWWLITRALWRRNRPFAVVEPAKLKRYATGRGNAGKDEVLSAVVRRYPMADVNGNDVADALVLAAMGADHLGHPLATVPQAHRAALNGITWPTLTTT